MRALTGKVNGYDVMILNYGVAVYSMKLLVTSEEVFMEKFLMNAKDIRLGWAQMQDDGDEIIYIYDKADGNYGYAVNLNDPNCSEWGYAPFE